VATVTRDPAFVLRAIAAAAFLGLALAYLLTADPVFVFALLVPAALVLLAERRRRT
jgi:ABC-type Mn2+/Zn2+ transport system permease subunit